MLTDNPKLAQKELLGSFKKEHGEYPSWTASKKTQNSKPARKPTKAASPNA
jgi:hypothetical protein